jgi:hypothetical protein
MTTPTHQEAEFDPVAHALKRAVEYPFHEVAPKDWAEHAACAVLYDLNDRKGIKHGFSGIDIEIRTEIVESLSAYIRRAATSQVEAATSEAVLWVESEPSTRGKDLRSIIDGMCHTVMYHSKKPATSNPVWPLYDHAAPQALPVASVSCPECGFGREHDPSCSRAAQAPLALPATEVATHDVSKLIELDDPELDAKDPFTRLFLLAEYWQREARTARIAAQAKPDLSGLEQAIIADKTLNYHFALNGGKGPVSDKGWKIINAIAALLAHPVAQTKPEARDAALEEAAMLCNLHAKHQRSMNQHSEMHVADFLAREIRAIKEKPEGS